MENNRNFLITIVLSVLILTLWQFFYMNPRIEQQRQQQQIEAQRQQEAQRTATPGAQPGTGITAVAPGAVPGTPSGTDGATLQDRNQALTATKRVPIDTPSLTGSINLTGGRLDDLKLKKYNLEVTPGSPIIDLLNPQALPNGQFAEIGYIGAETAGALPGPNTVWTTEGASLTPTTPVTLTFTNDKGLTFKRAIAVDENYMFTLTDTVTNASGQPVALSNYGRVTRFDKPTHAAAYSVHEGPIGVANETLQYATYATIEDEKQSNIEKTSDGWIGITDKYWGVALIPSSAQPFQPKFSYFAQGTNPGDRSRYQSDYLTDPINVAAGQTATVETRIFAGAKEVATVGFYAKPQDRWYNRLVDTITGTTYDSSKITMFDWIIDWGWYPYLTKPMFWLIDNLYKLLGNFGLAILATTVIVKAIFFPLANMSYKSMARMKIMQPKMLEIRDKYADDKMKQQQAMMELYKTEKINPVAGCWPVLVQIPVFFALYKVLYVTLDMRHQPFFGWIHDLAAPDPTSLFNLFGLIPITLPHMLMIGVWPLLMGVTMFLQMRMNPAPPDPTQAMVFNWMPVIFTFMMAGFPAGLVIYWAWNNLLSIIQQGVIMKRQGAKIELWDNLTGMFRKKPSPAE